MSLCWHVACVKCVYVWPIVVHVWSFIILVHELAPCFCALFLAVFVQYICADILPVCFVQSLIHPSEYLVSEFGPCSFSL